jgi:hypothetical protein
LIVSRWFALCRVIANHTDSTTRVQSHYSVGGIIPIGAAIDGAHNQVATTGCSNSKSCILTIYSNLNLSTILVQTTQDYERVSKPTIVWVPTTSSSLVLFGLAIDNSISSMVQNTPAVFVIDTHTPTATMFTVSFNTSATPFQPVLCTASCQSTVYPANIDDGDMINALTWNTHIIKSPCTYHSIVQHTPYTCRLTCDL